MSKHEHVYLTPEQRAHLEGLIHAGSVRARTQTRARILLLTDRTLPQRLTDAEIAGALLCNKNTVGNVRRRFLHGGMDTALYDQPRPGATPKLTGDVEAHLTLLACSTPPDGKQRWTLRMLADKLVQLQLVDSISDVAVMHHLKKTSSSRGA